MKKRFFFSSGLGNQLFQYGAYLKLKEIYPDVLADLTLLNYPSIKETPRKFELGDVISNLEHGSKTRRILLAYMRRYAKRLVSYENIDIASDWYLGYFQNKEYAITARNAIEDHFKEKMHSKDDACAFHVRLGDFATNKYAREVSNVITNHYISAALANIENFKEITVYSDEPLKAHKLISQFTDIEVKFPKCSIVQKTPWEDLLELSSYKTIICSNSTFSFWAAYLNHSDKKVIVPKKWFANSDEKPEYLPNTWISL